MKMQKYGMVMVLVAAASVPAEAAPWYGSVPGQRTDVAETVKKQLVKLTDLLTQYYNGAQRVDLSAIVDSMAKYITQQGTAEQQGNLLTAVQKLQNQLQGNASYQRISIELKQIYTILGVATKNLADYQLVDAKATALLIQNLKKSHEELRVWFNTLKTTYVDTKKSTDIKRAFDRVFAAAELMITHIEGAFKTGLALGQVWATYLDRLKDLRMTLAMAGPQGLKASDINDIENVVKMAVPSK